METRDLTFFQFLEDTFRKLREVEIKLLATELKKAENNVPLTTSNMPTPSIEEIPLIVEAIFIAHRTLLNIIQGTFNVVKPKITPSLKNEMNECFGHIFVERKFNMHLAPALFYYNNIKKPSTTFHHMHAISENWERILSIFKEQLIAERDIDWGKNILAPIEREKDEAIAANAKLVEDNKQLIKTNEKGEKNCADSSAVLKECHRQVAELRKQLQEKTDEVIPLHETIRNFEEKEQEWTNARNELTQEVSRLKTKPDDDGPAGGKAPYKPQKFQDVKKENQTLKDTIGVLKSQINVNLTSIIDLQKEIDRLQEENKTYQLRNNDLAQQNTMLQNQAISNVNSTSITDLQKNVDRLKEENNAYQLRNDELAKQNTTLHETIVTLQNQANSNERVLQTEVAGLRHKNAALVQERTNLEHEIQRNTNKLKENATKLKEKYSKLTQKNAELDALKAEIKDNNERMRGLCVDLRVEVPDPSPMNEMMDRLRNAYRDALQTSELFIEVATPAMHVLTNDVIAQPSMDFIMW